MANHTKRGKNATTYTKADYERLYMEQKGKCVVIARAVGISAEDAEDVAQVIFLRLWKQWPTPSCPLEALPAFVQRAAVNGACDVLRRRRTRARHLLTTVDTDYMLARLAGAVSDAPEFMAIYEESVAEAIHAIHSMGSQGERAALPYLLEGADLQETANALNVSKSAAKQTRHRMRAKIYAAMAESNGRKAS